MARAVCLRAVAVAVTSPSPSARGGPCAARLVHLSAAHHLAGVAMRPAQLPLPPTGRRLLSMGVRCMASKRVVHTAAVEEDTAPAAAEATPSKRERLDMGQRITVLDLDVEDLCPEEFDLVCDVRSPAEYEEDRVLGATSTPVMSNDERAVVGTMYKQESPFKAKRYGAAIVAKNMSTILLEHCQDLPKEAKILVYCWRGGERSCSLAHTLSRVGFDTTILRGGYKSYRAHALQYTKTLGRFRYHIIGGRTGSAKGKLLEELRAQGAQVLDLEGCADHRGSILGDEPDRPQPSQKMFESRLWNSMRGFDEGRVVFVEGESSRVGVRNVPESLWSAMKKSRSTEIVLPMDCRVAWTRQEYKHFETTHVDGLVEKLNRLRHMNGHEIVDKWLGWVDGGEWDLFVRDMLEVHYDPRYDNARKRDRSEQKAEVMQIPDMEDATYAAAAAALIAEIE